VVIRVMTSYSFVYSYTHPVASVFRAQFKMETAGCFNTLITTCKTTLSQKKENWNLKLCAMETSSLIQTVKFLMQLRFQLLNAISPPFHALQFNYYKSIPFLLYQLTQPYCSPNGHTNNLMFLWPCIMNWPYKIPTWCT